MKALTKMICLLGLSVAVAQVQDFGGRGTVDWGNRVVVAKGIGAPNPAMPAATARPMAIQAARKVALRNALEIIKGINLTSTTTVENYMVQNDQVRTSVSGYIQTFKESEPKYMSDKTIEITVTVPLDNKLASQILPPDVKPLPQAVHSVSNSSVNPSVNYSGLIIDARGLGVIPAVAPKVFDQEGKEIYGMAYVSREFAVKWGMAGYAKTPEQAQGMKDRLGEAPGYIKAVETKYGNIDLVLANNDARQIEKAAKSSKFFSDCRVVIIVD